VTTEAGYLFATWARWPDSRMIPINRNGDPDAVDDLRLVFDLTHIPLSSPAINSGFLNCQKTRAPGRGRVAL
jgi:hypothetical protein